MGIKDLETKKIPISEINPAKYNPRKDLQPEDEEYKKIESSINEFGYVEPIVWNENTGNLVGGHQRFKILLDKGIDEVNVSVVNLDETKEKLLNLALNKVAGEWDEDKLESLLTEIKDCADIALSGFDEQEIDNIIRVCNQESDNFIDELINDDFVSINSEKEYFQVSFSFENKYRNLVENFVKETGKQYIVEKILQWIQ